jgi:hypothetical protein
VSNYKFNKIKIKMDLVIKKEILMRFNKKYLKMIILELEDLESLNGKILKMKLV